MRSSLRVFVGVVTLVLLPASVWAQAAITGVVRDTSGGVMPGVTVEVASPVLIERVRTAVTDPTGQYRIVDLRPGTYSIVFSLTGFSTVRREGIELSGTFIATINGDLRVGSLQETDYGQRRDADRRRPEREGAEHRRQGRPDRDPEFEERHRHPVVDSRDGRGRRLRRHYRWNGRGRRKHSRRSPIRLANHG